MLPAFKEKWGGLPTGPQAGLGDRKLLIAALPWKEWVWLRCDAKLLAGTASKCWKSCLLTLEWASYALGRALSLLAWGLLVLAFESELCGQAVQVQVWRTEAVSSWSASGCGGCFFCSSATSDSLKFPYAPVLSCKSQFSVSEATWFKDREVRKMLFHTLKF